MRSSRHLQQHQSSWRKNWKKTQSTNSIPQSCFIEGLLSLCHSFAHAWPQTLWTWIPHWGLTLLLLWRCLMGWVPDGDGGTVLAGEALPACLAVSLASPAKQSALAAPNITLQIKYVRARALWKDKKADGSTLAATLLTASGMGCSPDYQVGRDVHH